MNLDSSEKRRITENLKIRELALSYASQSVAFIEDSTGNAVVYLLRPEDDYQPQKLMTIKEFSYGYNMCFSDDGTYLVFLAGTRAPEALSFGIVICDINKGAFHLT